jgi:hypothetical protein
MKTTQFVIGIGSQRAGSTLLHRILDQCTTVFMHPVKELHYFDTLYNVRHQDVLIKYSQKQVERELDNIITAKEYSFLEGKKYKCYLRTNNILSRGNIDDVNYLDLYRPCLLGNEMIGEITPEYMILPEDGVKHMAQTLGKEALIILIKRNPVERFISAFKLLKAYGNENVDMSNFESEILEVFETMPTWVAQQKELNDYIKAEEKFRKYFDNVLVISYEELTTEPDVSYAILRKFLKTEIDKEKFYKILETRVNQIGKTSRLSEKAKTQITKAIL